MNAGCYGREFKDIIISIQALDEDGRILSIPKEKINVGLSKKLKEHMRTFFKNSKTVFV